MCKNYLETIELLKTSEKYKSLVLVNHIHLVSPAFIKLKSLIKNKNLTKIRSYGYAPGPIRNYSALLDWSPHDFSMIFSLLGLKSIITIVSASCKKGNSNRSAWTIKLTSGKINMKIRLGNLSKSKKRFFSVETDKKEKIIYNDLLSTDKKINLNNKFMKVSDVQPLVAQIKRFINYENFDTHDMKLSLKIAKTLNEIEDQENLIHDS